MREPQLLESTGGAIDECRDTELGDESSQLARGSGSFGEIDEVDLDPAFGKEPQRLTRIGTLSCAEDLHGSG